MTRRNKKSRTRFIQAAVLEHGRHFTPAFLPRDIRPGPIGKCFDWCALETARLRPKYQYVEGLASDPDDPGNWVLHAWLTDGERAFDPTWHSVDNKTGRHVPIAPVTYIGIPMQIRAVHAFMKATGYQGVLGNRWRHPQLADQAIKSCIRSKEPFYAEK